MARTCVDQQVKNADGTTTTRTANGAKITRPALKRNPSSANRLAAVAAGNNAAAKLYPLTRSKTADPTPTHLDQPGSSPTKPSPKQQSAPKAPKPLPFQSSIYCSAACAQTDAGRSTEAYKDIARTFSYDFSGLPLDSINTHGVPITDRGNPYAPPSPLFVSSSDTDSSTTGGPDSGPACSAPNNLGFFRMSREGPDDAWNDVQRQRRSSMNPAIQPISLVRYQSNTSAQGWGDVSSDSLSSLWNTTASEQELNLARSTSNGPKSRSVAFAPTAAGERDGLGYNRRSSSNSSDRSGAPIPSRPIMARSNLSHTSLAASPPNSVPPVGSAPNETLDLLRNYATAFPVRDASGRSQSYCQKGFASPGSQSSQGLAGIISDSRRSSVSVAHMQQQNTGTIRAKSRSASNAAPTWDSYGRDEVNALNARAAARAMPCKASVDTQDCTPKQSLEVENGQWKIKYHSHVRPVPKRATSSSSSSCSQRSSDAASTELRKGVSIDTRPHLGTSFSSTTHARTPLAPTAMPPPAAIPFHRSTTSTATPSSSVPARGSSSAGMPDLATLRIGSSGCAPYTSSDNAMCVKQGFDWSAHEKKGGKTYEIPNGIKIDRSKAGLFYFQ